MFFKKKDKKTTKKSVSKSERNFCKIIDLSQALTNTDLKECSDYLLAVLDARREKSQRERVIKISMVDFDKACEGVLSRSSESINLAKIKENLFRNNYSNQ